MNQMFYNIINIKKNSLCYASMRCSFLFEKKTLDIRQRIGKKNWQVTSGTKIDFWYLILIRKIILSKRKKERAVWFTSSAYTMGKWRMLALLNNVI